MRRSPIALCTLLAISLLGGCGGDEDSGGGSSAQPAPSASAFPATAGRSLDQVLSEANGEGPVVSLAGEVLKVGTNRVGFGVFSVDRTQIPDAEIAIYAAPRDMSGEAVGPFPARVEELTTEPEFRADTTVNDPDAATVVYVANIKLDRPGEWVFAALTRSGDGYQGSLIPVPAKVGEFDTPGVGDKAPRISTQTAADVADISEIDTRIPPDTMHDVNFADALGKRPIVLIFATPQLCQSRTCGPVVDVAEQVKSETGGDVAFIHQEIYVDNQVDKGVRPQVSAFNLPSEPWLFVIDRKGIIRTAIEGAFSPQELEDAVQAVE